MARRRSAEETRRAEIAEAALRLILKFGFHSTTLDQVAAEAGVSKGLVSYYFSKKEELFLAVLERMVDRLSQDLERCYRTDVSARERLRLNFMNLFGNEQRTLQYYTVVIDFLGEALREKTVRAYTHTIYDTVLTYIEWTVTDGIREAIARAGINPEDVDEVYFGNTRQAGNGPNPPRTAAVRAGVPADVNVCSLTMACPSGMKALILAAQSIQTGDNELCVIGGQESMSTIPYMLKDIRWEGTKMGDRVLMDGWNDTIGPLCDMGMGQ